MVDNRTPRRLPFARAWIDAIAGLLAQHRLLEVVREQARRQATLVALTADLPAVREPRAILERAVSAAAELLGAQAVAAFLCRGDGRGFDVVASRGLAPLIPGEPALSMENSVAGRAVAGGTMQAVDDAAVERAAGTEFPRLCGDVHIGAVLVAPICEESSEPVGVLEVYASAPQAWSDEDCALLRALAAACAVALRTARETDRARRDALRSRVLAELGATLHGADDLEAALQRLVQGACVALEASRATLLRRTTPDDPPTITHEHTAAGIRPVAGLVDLRTPPLFTAMAASPDRTQTLAIDDIAGHPALAVQWAAVPDEQRLRAIVATPLVDDGRVLGVLSVHQCGHPRRWEPEEVAFLETLAAQVGAALRQRRLFVAAREDARRLAALNRVADTLIGAPTFGAMCDRVLATLDEVLRAAIGRIFVYDESAPAERALRVVAWHGVSDEQAAALVALPLGAGLAGQAALRRAIVCHERLDDAPPEAGPTLALARQEGVEARAAVPMLVRGRLLGALVVAAREARRWSEDDLSLLQAVANQLAAALEAEQLRSAAVAAAAAQRAERLKDELLSTVSHELRTPLGAIKGFASGLRHYGDRLGAAERAESLQLIDEAADRLAELIDDLLDVQWLEAGRLAVAHGRADLAEIAATVLREMVPRAPKHALDLVVAPGLPPVSGDARRLRQVIQNLVENAVKYSPDGGRVVVRLRRCGQTVELRVEDEGLGIPADQLTRIFERFHRIDNTTTRSVGGSGLGLSIVKGLVRAHGGTIYAESAGEGQGSSFVVRLPRAHRAARMPGERDKIPVARGEA